MKKHFSRILSLVLSFVLLLSVLPSAGAAGVQSNEERLIDALVAAVAPTNAILNSHQYAPNGRIAEIIFDRDAMVADVVIDDTQMRAIKMLEVPFLKTLFSYKDIYALQIGEDLVEYESMTQFSIMLAVGHNTIGEGMSYESYYVWLRSQAETLTVSSMDGHDVDVTVICRTDRDDPDTEYSVKVRMNIYNRLHKITWKFNNGEADYVRDKLEVGSTIARPNPVPPAGMKFYRWEPAVPAQMGTTDLTFEAIWIPTDHAGYEVRHRLQSVDLKGYDLVETEYLHDRIGDAVLGSDKAKTFEGFKLNSGLGEASVSKTVTEDGTMKINLYYDRINVKISWDWGFKIVNKAVKYGLMPEPPEMPTPPNDGREYVFVRWDREIVPATEATTYRARYADDKMLVLHLDANGGAVTPSELYLYIGETLAGLPTPTREGNTFLGWFYKNGSPVDPARVVDDAGEETIVARWKVNQYTIYFDTDGGTAIPPMTLDYGTVITPPPDPEREDCKFLGWSPLLPYTMPAKTLFVVAQWHIHNIVIDPAVPATCTAPGKTAGEHCIGCDYKIEQQTIPALGHDFLAGEVVTPSCVEDGYTVYTCTRCGLTENRDAVPAHGHTWDAGAVTTPATANTDGIRTFTCTVCGATRNEVIPATGGAGCAHASSHQEHSDATCTEAGYDRVVCDQCGLYLSETTTPALGHDYKNYPAQAATCTEAGWNAYRECTRCHDSDRVGIPALGHDYENHAAKPATCTEPGWNAYQTCSRCDYTTYAEIAALGHNIVPDAAKPATCTAPGLTAGEHCTRCDYRLAQEIVPALGHDYAVSALTAATCTAGGSVTYACSRCSDRYTVTLDPLGHDYEVTERIAPTCTAAGSETSACTRCGNTVTNTLPRLGHDFRVTVVAPTCTERGYTFYECMREGCGYTEKGSWTAALGHGHAYPEHKDPTCTEPGYDRTICDDCGAVISEEILPALGHDLIVDAAKPATCTEPGLSEGSHCSRCDYKVEPTVVPALGHNWDAGVVTAPATADRDGVKTFTCTRCGATRTEAIPATGKCDGGPTCPSYKFTDVTVNSWFHEAVDFAVKRGLFNGMNETTFGPDVAMTRGMLVTVLWRYEGSPKEGTIDFVDVHPGEWFADAVAWAAANKIVNGVGNGRFDPDGEITREQMAAILYRYSDFKGYDVSKRGDFAGFPDKAKVSVWAKEAYGWAVAEKLISGNKIGSQTLLDPQGNATRAQVATVLMRFIQKFAE